MKPVDPHIDPELARVFAQASRDPSRPATLLHIGADRTLVLEGRGPQVSQIVLVGSRQFS